MSELFNTEALQALDDKNELKEIPRVASPGLWLLLTSLLMICVVALIWCIFGKLNYTVNANAVVFPFAEARPISVPFEGTVHRVIATNGQKVAAGAPIVNVRSQLATTTLTSPENGVVLTSKPAESKFVAREPVVWILPQQLQFHDREVLAYVPFAHLRKVKAGAKVQVTPSDLEREKWGYAVGTVTGIEQYPTDRQAVAQRLKLAELAAIIPADQPVYEVRIVLDRGDDGLVWSRKKSQSMAVTTGMPCNVQIIWSQKYVWEVLAGRVENIMESLQGKVPMVMQMEAVECGAASLSMILAYFGKWLPLEQVREACCVSRDGSSMKNILIAAESYGLKPSAYKVSAEGLAGMEPAIIHWNFEHFVVFKGMKKGKACLNDPGIGPVEVPMDEFRRSFTGVAMTFELTDRFEPSGHPTSIFSYIRRNMSGAYEAFWMTFIFALLLAFVTLALPLFTRVFFDEILSGRNAQWAKVFFCLMAVLAVFHFVVVLWQQRYAKRIAGQLALRSNTNFMRHLMRLPMSFFAMRYVGDLQQRQQLNETITHSLVEVLAPQIINVMLLVLYLVLMLSYNYTLTLIGVLAVVVNLGVVRYYSHRRLNMVRSTQQSEGKYYSATVSCLENIESIKAAGAEEGFFQYWCGLWARKFNKEREMHIQQSQMNLLPSLTQNLLSMAVLLVGAWYILQGDLSVGMLMAFQGFMAAFMAPVDQIVHAGLQLVEMRSQMERVEDVMKYPEDRQAEGRVSEEGKLLGELELRDVTFGYNPMNPPLIEHFNLHLKSGESVAFVGSSGCGKSTLAKLISGLYKPWSGEILFDGRPGESISRDELTASVAVVSQDITLFDDTLEQNIRMWDQSIEDFTIRFACDDAQLHSDIVKRPQGYATKVVRGGQNFSGGQCQRIEIATALAREPMILILDEATSALDPTTEEHVMRRIREMGITLIVVAHRLSTIRDCSQIIVMDDGCVVQRGTHDELMRQKGRYRELMESN